MATIPPAFISVGNGDDLRPQSIALADALEKNGVRVDRLIFPEGSHAAAASTSTSSSSIGRKRGRRSTDRSSSLRACAPLAHALDGEHGDLEHHAHIARLGIGVLVEPQVL